MICRVLFCVNIVLLFLVSQVSNHLDTIGNGDVEYLRFIVNVTKDFLGICPVVLPIILRLQFTFQQAVYCCRDYRLLLAQVLG